LRTRIIEEAVDEKKKRRKRGTVKFNNKPRWQYKKDKKEFRRAKEPNTK